jgi:spermidine/putrescine transport system substrate-binding protein
MSQPNRPNDLALARGLTGSRLGRRDALRMFGAAGGAAALAACGVGAQGSKVDTSTEKVDDYWSTQQETGKLNWANWPLYLDKKKGKNPSLDQFRADSGIDVTYLEDIQDNGPFFAKVQPSLSAGEYSGYDLAVISNGIFFNKFRDLGFFVPLDQDRLTNFRQYAGDRFQNEAFDPGNVFSIPWQAGFTGIGYDPAKTGREITSWEDLQDPAFKGKIGMFANNEDLPNCALLAIGKDPLTSTEADWQEAAAWLTKQQPLVRQYYSQNYIQALATGDVWITMAWSGDIFQENLSGRPNGLQFVIPEEGGLLFVDNMVILKEAQNPVSAMELMDYYYQPEVAAEVTEWVNYISPVPDAQAVVQRHADEASGGDRKFLENVAKSYATFPGEDIYAKVTNGFTPTEGAELDTWNEIFQPIFQS